jgi:hypothetical protein
MSTVFTGAPGPLRLTGRGRVGAVFVIAAARALAHLSPHRLRHILEFVQRGAQPAAYQQAAAARESVVRFSIHCQGEGCLPRSIAAALLCRLDGAWPTWCVGVITSPLAAHAWIEADGRIVDEPQGTDRFRVLIRVEPQSSHGDICSTEPENMR